MARIDPRKVHAVVWYRKVEITVLKGNLVVSRVETGTWKEILIHQVHAYLCGSKWNYADSI